MRNISACIYLIAVLIVSIFSQGCGKETQENPNETCRITKFYSPGDTSQNAIKFFYDNSERLARIVLPSPPGTTSGSNIVYGTNTIIITDLTGSSDRITYYLTPDSLAYASATYRQGSRTDTVNYFYNASKNLIKAVRYNHVFGKDSTLLTYVDNNLVLLKSYLSNGAVDQVTYEYGTADAKIWFYQNIGQYLAYDQYYPWFGKSSSKLIKSFSSTFNGNPQPVTVTYNLTVSGYISGMTTTHLGNSAQTNFEYACQ